MKIRTNFYDNIFYCILFTGAILALVQYFFNRSLWWDEASLALNIIHRNFFQLLKPLDGTQVAPILFLQLEKLFSLMIPDSEYGLRLFPLLSYLVALFIFYKILIKILPDPFSVTFSLSLFVFNLVLIRYSSEVKQYMTDLLVCTAMFYLLTRDYKSEAEKLKVLAFTGIISVFMSNISPILLSSAGMYLVYKYLIEEHKNLKGMLLVFSLWGLFFLIYYFAFIHNHPAEAFMIKYWSEKPSFLPSNPFDPDFIHFFKAKNREVFNQLLFMGKNGQIVLPLFFLIGLFSIIIKRKTEILILTISPIIIHLLLSAMHIYPFFNRLILYLIPLIIIITGHGLAFLLSFVFKKIEIRKTRYLVILIPAFFINIFLKKEFPVKVKEIKKSIEFLNKHKNQDEALFVVFSLANSFKYYQATGFTDISQVESGNSSWNFKEGFIEDVKKTKSGLWILSGRDLNKNNKESIIFMELDSAGITYSQKFADKGTSLYFIDFEQRQPNK